MTFAIGLVLALACMLGGFAAMGGHLEVLVQPWELVIIGGSALGTFIAANTIATVKDSGKAVMEALLEKKPKTSDFLEVLGLLHAMMRELRAKGRNEIEAHVDNPSESAIFKNYPAVLGNHDLTTFICDYMRLIIIGNARPHEIEALMDEEIETMMHDKLKPYQAMTVVSDSLPALGIVAAVLGVIKAMGALDQSPELLGGLIGAALVGTFAGIFMSYGMLSPLANKIKATRVAQERVFIVAKQVLLAFMNGAMPQIAVEHGRKTISSKERPTIDEVETATIDGGAANAKAA
ncbi:MAG: flagellar motor stator protein MotA [Rhizobiales bacterium]|nr:flagellar motor stator protein MotA [Hyphomicrobiales bacterium]